MGAKNKMLLLTAVLGVFALSSRAQNNMIVSFLDKEQLSTPLSDIRKITFSDNNLVMELMSGTSSNHSLLSIRNVVFGSETSAISEVVSSQKMAVYPNPATDLLTISNLPSEDVNVRIYNVSGVLMLSVEASSGSNSINVRGLSDGIYIIRANGQSLRFFKK